MVLKFSTFSWSLIHILTITWKESLKKHLEIALSSSPHVDQIPKDQLDSLEKRLLDLEVKAGRRIIKLKYLEHKVI